MPDVGADQCGDPPPRQLYRFEEVFDLSLPDGLAAMGLGLEALVPLTDLLAMPRPQLDGKREGESRRKVARYPDFDLAIGDLQR
jgi:hypothetical protein